MNLEVEVPDLGMAGGDQATIVEWNFEEDDEVEQGEVLVEIESESATVLILSPCKGVLLKRVVEEDDIVRVGEIVALLECLEEDTLLA